MDKRIFFMTVNKYEEYTISCIQNWIEIAFLMDAFCYFICDNEELEEAIQKKVSFHDSNYSFIPSLKSEDVIQKSKIISSEKWVNACRAHLTSFYVAKELGIKEYWKIDADDTLFCMPPEYVVKGLREVENIAKDKEIEAFSLDMWHSRTKGTHWSFGIAFMRDQNDFCDIFSRIKDDSWINNKYRTGDGSTNIDWFFTFMKMEGLVSCETFYIDNAYYIHFGNFLRYPKMTAAVYLWKDNKILYPIFRYLFNDERNGYIDIAKDDYRIDIDLTSDVGIDFMRKNLGMEN